MSVEDRRPASPAPINVDNTSPPSPVKLLLLREEAVVPVADDVRSNIMPVPDALSVLVRC